ncbi:hypothetical protein HPP92_028531 [Vanilla planifolia]|uniref:Uncharacterized protein n=1 Tax=Vanilla planifolia TaxID=51239 RepID=A0A835U434_VANPL|nr:hypothetical protein HPP92_028531 [Vanilla planifolia]
MRAPSSPLDGWAFGSLGFFRPWVFRTKFSSLRSDNLRSHYVTQISTGLYYHTVTGPTRAWYLALRTTRGQLGHEWFRDA